MATSQANRKSRTDSAADLVLVLLLTAIVVIALLAVFCRYVLNHSLVWSDEVVRYLFVWFTLLGAAITLRDREHLRVEYFVELLPAGPRRFVEWVTLVGVLLFYLAMLVLGFMWVYETSGTSTSALKWPLNWFFYAALPASAALGAWYAVRRLKRGQYAELDATADESGPATGGSD
jgi:TRAP-type C4-dicarboxylate transport system permease small subunit